MAKYRDISNDIRNKILSGEYSYGQKLPYEYVLCVTYHCNKETMKKALDILVKEGLIIRRRGAGTFVKEYDSAMTQNVHKMNVRGLTDRYAGEKEIENDIIEFEVVAADEFLAKKLLVEEGDFVYHIIRLRKVDGEPYLIDISYMPINLIPNLKVVHLKGSIYDYIQNTLHLKIQSCHLTIRAELSTQLEQQYLGLKKGEPYIEEEQISYLSSGAIFEYTLARHPYKNFEFSTIVLE